MNSLLTVHFICILNNNLQGWSTVEPPITDPPSSEQPPYNGQSPWHGLKSLPAIIHSQFPRSGRFSIRTADNSGALIRTLLYKIASILVECPALSGERERTSPAYAKRGITQSWLTYYINVRTPP